ncbi:MAG: TlpA family protein disulfide reductase [Candidatus Methylomirabilales bacterium]
MIAPERVPGEKILLDPAPRRTRRGRWKLLLVVVFVGAFAALLSFGFTRDPGLLRSALEGRLAPDFALQDMDGGDVVRLSDFRGRVVVLNFWASWCVACREEHPNFVAAWDMYRERGVMFIGILFQDTPDNARRYMEELGGDWPTLLDPGSRAAIDYGLYGVPETFFIAPDGTIRRKQVGASSYQLLTGEVERILAEREAR